jgi:hypothetical protein
MQLLSLPQDEYEDLLHKAKAINLDHIAVKSALSLLEL